jgi:hypothetical protein
VSALDVAAIVDAAARVVAGAIDGHIFAAGVTQSVTDAAPQVVPIADDFTEGGLPAVTVAMTDWAPILQPGNERAHLTIRAVVWRPRAPLSSHADLYGDLSRILDAWLAHAKAYLEEAHVQSALVKGGPGIVPRTLPRGDQSRVFLTLPVDVEIVTNRLVLPQPA